MNAHRTHGPDDTEALAARVAAKLHAGSVLLLEGDLGSGKTCFVRGLVRGLGGNPEQVSSPTFTLVHQYPGTRLPVFHWDLYRLEPETNWAVLDLDDHLTDPNSVTLVEWPERRDDWATSAPAAQRIVLQTLSETERKIIFLPSGESMT